jgi:predicted AAA+ superfamily ATPase
MYERFVERWAEEALSDTPVVLIVGPRRAGKTTLVRKMGEVGRTYITLDDQTVLDAAQSDPVASFVAWIGPSSTRSSARPTCCWRSRRR